MRRTAHLIEEHKAAAAIQPKPKGKPRGKPFAKGNKHGNRFKPGQSGNPGGKPGVDLSALAARRLFEAAGEGELPEIPKGFNAYAYSVLADRAYGKVKDKQVIEHTGPGGAPLTITVKLVKPSA